MEDIIDMNIETDQEKVAKDLNKFQTNIKYFEAKYKNSGKDLDYYVILQKSILWAYLPEIGFCVTLAVISESSAVFYSYFISYMIRYIKDEEAPIEEGIKYVAIFFLAQMIA